MPRSAKRTDSEELLKGADSPLAACSSVEAEAGGAAGAERKQDPRGERARTREKWMSKGLLSVSRAKIQAAEAAFRYKQKRAQAFESGPAPAGDGEASAAATREDCIERRERFRLQFKKTELCRFYPRCTKGEACSFAHTDTELAERPDLTKTSICKAWVDGGCPFRSRDCAFAHGLCELRMTGQFMQADRERDAAKQKQSRRAARRANAGAAQTPTSSTQTPTSSTQTPTSATPTPASSAQTPTFAPRSVLRKPAYADAAADADAAEQPPPASPLTTRPPGTLVAPKGPLVAFPAAAARRARRSPSNSAAAACHQAGVPADCSGLEALLANPAKEQMGAWLADVGARMGALSPAYMGLAELLLAPAPEVARALMAAMPDHYED